MTVSAMKHLAIYISLRYKGIETNQEMKQVFIQMAMLLLYYILLENTIYKYVGNVPSPVIKSFRKK